MAYCRTLIRLNDGRSPGDALPVLLEALGLEVEQPGLCTLLAVERPVAGRPVRDYVRLWADWSDCAQTGELWLETLSGESMARRHTRCSDVMERIRQALGA